MQRYFGFTKQGQICLCDGDIFHLSTVMRARIGELVEVVAEEKILLCKVASFKPFKLDVIEAINENNELPNKVTLIVGLLKGDHMDLVLQKATELGVDEVILLDSERTVAKIKDESKLERFRKILKEASEQSKRNKIPTLNKIIKIDQLSQISADFKLIAYEGEQGSSKSFFDCIKKVEQNNNIAIVVGPEGGFSKKEVEFAEKNGFIKVGLGRRILRAETACFYVMSVISNYLENK